MKKVKQKESELPKAGKKSGGIYSPQGGVKLPVKRENTYHPPKGYSHTFGWKNFF